MACYIKNAFPVLYTGIYLPSLTMRFPHSDDAPCSESMADVTHLFLGIAEVFYATIINATKAPSPSAAIFPLQKSSVSLCSMM